MSADETDTHLVLLSDVSPAPERKYRSLSTGIISTCKMQPVGAIFIYQFVLVTNLLDLHFIKDFTQRVDKGRRFGTAWGDSAGARRDLEAALALPEDDEELTRFRAEAEELLRLKEQSK